MKTKNACILLLAALALTACDYDDSALWEQVNQNTEDIAAQAERIAALEAWQAETNTNIQSLQTLLNTTDHITDVTPVTENDVEVGYTISFLNSDPVTIYHGKKGDEGDTPRIGVMQGEDDNWYWTLNGKPLTDANEGHIRANGEKGDPAPVPQLSTGSSLTTQGVTQDADGTDIDPEAIYLSVDGGEKWTRVSGEDGEQGDKGDSFFSKVDTIDPTCVTFTLADGTTTFSVPRYTGIKVDLGEQSSIQLLYGATQPVNFTAEGSDQFTADNLFIIAPDGWKASAALTRATGTAFSLTVTAPADATSGAAEGEILVMLDNGQGSTTIGRLTVKAVKYIIDGTELTASGLEAGKLAEAIGDRSDLTSITVTSGTLNKEDWAAVVENNATLLYLDLAGATYTGDDAGNLIYKTADETSPIISIKLPQGITALGVAAFHGCTSLTSITLPEGVTSIEKGAFLRCTSLTSIDLPERVTTIGDYAFYSCTSLTSITLPARVTNFGLYPFYSCSALETVTCLGTTPPTMRLSGDIFNACPKLANIYVPASSVNAYKTATGWSDHEGIIQAIQ